MYEIKKIREYLKEGIRKFSVLERGEIGKVITMTIIHSVNSINKQECKEEATTSFAIFPDGESGVIKTVSRLSDEKIFKQSDYIYFIRDNTQSCGYIKQFKEDLIHCVIIELFEQNDECEKIIDIDNVSLEQFDLGNDEVEEE